jgi:hypothetical protein
MARRVGCAVSKGLPVTACRRLAAFQTAALANARRPAPAPATASNRPTKRSVPKPPALPPQAAWRSRPLRPQPHGAASAWSPTCVQSQSSASGSSGPRWRIVSGTATRACRSDGKAWLYGQPARPQEHGGARRRRAIDQPGFAGLRLWARDSSVPMRAGMPPTDGTDLPPRGRSRDATGRFRHPQRRCGDGQNGGRPRDP